MSNQIQEVFFAATKIVKCGVPHLGLLSLKEQAYSRMHTGKLKSKYKLSYEIFNIEKVQFKPDFSFLDQLVKCYTFVFQLLVNTS